ncbi:NAD(P)/FAD-dependent oxidoreductase [Leptolyngbya sp. FACHB-261]|uniref:NAD(P)/FAD-dependent oxidoreductase n=1 Tax=Leptolyngbya sp. FACHB-261 TaxID=2692806 RepID=UPI001681DE7D|nr:FAD-dependent oxidoreductase [Leptolyngbya sp. FACHB-261]MBD2101477.1 FAD-dependent oxidoreductase [Leptolyngbya sp. FACHB-261]
MAKRYFVIGAGVAGISAAEEIRRGDESAEITVINGESYPFYRRLSLSTYLQGHTTLPALIVKQPQDYEALAITVLQDRVSQLEADHNRLMLESGEVCNYDGLVIATGGKALRPPIEGLELTGVRLGYWDIEDTLWYEERAKQVQGRKARAVVVGGGVLGLELADCLNKAGLEVTVLQLTNWLGDPLADELAGRMIEERVRESGADYRVGTSATRLLSDEHGHVRAVVTSTGEEIAADMVGICCGIQPNVSWLEGSGVRLERGCVAVNEVLGTNYANIYAAGDCTWVQGGMMIGRRPNRTWQVATLQGLVAAQNLLGAKRVYDEGLFYNAGVLYDLPYTLLGKFNPAPEEGCESRLYDTAGDPFAYFKLNFQDGRLVGALLLGQQRRTPVLRKIMEGNYIVTGHEHELMDLKFKPKGLPVADINNAGDAEVESKLAAYAKAAQATT